MIHDRESIGRLIADRILDQRDTLFAQWHKSRSPHYCWIDDLLPDDLINDVSGRLPKVNSLRLHSSLRERKRSSSDPTQYDPLVRETMYAFQQPVLVKAIGELVQAELQGDPTFYAGGVSAMSCGDFLNPHVDNSHDGEGRLYRALNLLYYVSPGWVLENGGNLELWDPQVKTATTIVSAFNRLVVMATDDRSWHSVSKVAVERPRYCLSNYFFSSESPTGQPFRQVTTFTGRPDEPLKSLILKITDGVVFNAIGKYLPSLTGQKQYRHPKS